MKFIMMILIFWHSVGMAASLCDRGQTVFFSCQLQKSKKIISICGEKNDSFINFRFGHKNKLDLNYKNKIGDIYQGDVYLFSKKNPSGLEEFSVDFIIKIDEHYAFSVYKAHRKNSNDEYDSSFIVDSFLHGTGIFGDKCQMVDDFQKLEELLPYSASEEFFSK